MNIAVIAANGRSGRVFVKYALEGGHTIRAGVHGDATLDPHPNLTVLRCDATNEAEVGALIDGQDAVISFIGHVKHSPPRVQTDMVRVVAAAMIAKGITRFVTLTGTGVRFPGDKITLLDRVGNAVIRVIDPERIQDGKDHVVALQQTGLEWTVLRVLKLMNRRATPYALKEHGPTKLFVSRDEVASAALEVLENHSYVRQAPILGRPAET